MNREPVPGERGFTLLELIIVMIIVGLLAGTVMPRVGAGWKHMAEREFMQAFAHSVSLARLEAMNSGRAVCFRIRSKTRTYGTEIPPEKPIPTNADLFVSKMDVDPGTGDDIIVFYPDGTPSGGYIEVIFDKVRIFSVSINALTGSATWAEGNG